MNPKQYFLLLCFSLLASGLQSVPNKKYNLTIYNKTGKNGTAWGACKVNVEHKDSNTRVIIPRGKSADLSFANKISTFIVKTSKGAWELKLDFSKQHSTFNVTNKEINLINNKSFDGAKLKDLPKKVS